MFRYEIQPSTRGLEVFVPNAELGITFHLQQLTRVLDDVGEFHGESFPCLALSQLC